MARVGRARELPSPGQPSTRWQAAASAGPRAGAGWVRLHGRSSRAGRLPVRPAPWPAQGLRGPSAGGGPAGLLRAEPLPLARAPFTPLASPPLMLLALAERLVLLPDRLVPARDPLARLDRAVGLVPLARVRLPPERVPADRDRLVPVPLRRVLLARVPPALVPLARVPAVLVPAARVPLARVPVARVPVARVPVARVPVARVPAVLVPLARVPVARVPAARVRVARAPVARAVDRPRAAVAAGRARPVVPPGRAAPGAPSLALAGPRLGAGACWNGFHRRTTA